MAKKVKITQLDIVNDYIQFREGWGLEQESIDLLERPEIKKQLEQFTAYECIDLANYIIGYGIDDAISEYFDVDVEDEEDEEGEEEE